MAELIISCPKCGGEMRFQEKYYFCVSCKWRVSKYDVDAELSIIKVLEDVGVAYRNEFRYRLEGSFYHTVTDYAVRRLEESKAYRAGLRIERTALPGRKSTVRGTPNVFYRALGVDYNTLIPVMKKKLELSTFISQLSSPAGFHAQYLWRDAFLDLGYTIEAEDASEFRGKKASVEGDIDFIAQKDGLFFGVDVKNTLEYPEDLGRKVQIAIELETLPVMIVRRVTWDVYSNLKKSGVLTKIYETSIFPKTYKSVVDQCIETLGFPVIALDKITKGTRDHLENMVMAEGFKNIKELKRRNREYLVRVLEYRRRMETLNKELRFI